MVSLNTEIIQFLSVFHAPSPVFLSTLNTLNFNTHVPDGLTWRIVQQKQCCGEDPETSGQEMQEHIEKPIKTEKKQKAHKNHPVLPEDLEKSHYSVEGWGDNSLSTYSFPDN